ncbi:50S ribosomal protein L18 [Patescibacteria group bacterium]|nr:50S ribosomal protein L18 [Patescibacteria group bacterium]
MNWHKFRQQKRDRIHKKVRKKINGTAERPRLSVYRSNTNMYAQIIDDEKSITILSANAKELKSKGTKKELAKELGVLIAKKAKDKKITKIVFDRGAFRYHGRVRALAEGVREGGLEF